MVEKRLSKLENEYGHRRGLIGAEAAEERFRDAVFSYLMEDYERAAVVFYTLVEADALVESTLAEDAEWFLAECLFEEGNYVTAVEAYNRIIEKGRGHLFFNDAVRRQLESYGHLKDKAGFYRVYNRFIVTEVVPTTDAVKYSVAKSFYYQDDNARSKAIFAEIPRESSYFTRARYFMGAVLVAEGQLELAVKQFEVVDTHALPATAANYHGYGGIRDFAKARAVEAEVHELARLALGRLHYELGDFEQAQRYYQDIRQESTHFTDQMYELVWTYVRQDKWLEAINQIEICLISDPDHIYSFQLRLLLGHMHMRREDFTTARGRYQDVVDTYSPIRDHLQALKRNSVEPQAFFNALVSSEDPGAVDPKLPGFAVDLLVNDDQMGRAVDARRALNRQDEDVEYSRELVDLVGPALRAGTDGIGTFRQGRASIAAVQGDDLKLRADITEFELLWLEAHSDANTSGRLIPLRERWEILVGRTGQVRNIETAATERQSAHAAQVREVQHLGFQVRQVVLDQIAQVTATKRRLRENASGLNDGEISRIRVALDRVQAELKSQLDGLERIEGEAARRRVMSTVSSGPVADTGSQRKLIADDLRQLHTDLVAMRRQVGAPADVYGRVDQIWTQSEGFERRSAQTMGRLEVAERTELALMRTKLAGEVQSLGAIGGDLVGASSEMDSLARGITRAGIGRVEETFNETVMGADRGIVDVYWVTMNNVIEEKNRLAEERNKRRAEAEARFKMIDSRMNQLEVETPLDGAE